MPSHPSLSSPIFDLPKTSTSSPTAPHPKNLAASPSKASLSRRLRSCQLIMPPRKRGRCAMTLGHGMVAGGGRRRRSVVSKSLQFSLQIIGKFRVARFAFVRRLRQICTEAQNFITCASEICTPRTHGGAWRGPPAPPPPHARTLTSTRRSNRILSLAVATPRSPPPTSCPFKKSVAPLLLSPSHPLLHPAPHSPPMISSAHLVQA
jgi:hypothetical protein